MWPFTRKTKTVPALNCVGKSILDDLSKHPASEWQISESKGCFGRRWYETFSHPKVKYSLHACLSDSDDRYVSILGVDENVLGRFEQCQIWRVLCSIKNGQADARRAARKKESEEKLKQLFPHCYGT